MENLERELEDLIGVIDLACKYPALNAPTGTFYENAMFWEGLAKHPGVPSFQYESAHSPFSDFLKWAPHKLGVDPKNLSGGWVALRLCYNSDREAFDDFPRLFRQFLAEFDQRPRENQKRMQ